VHTWRGQGAPRSSAVTLVVSDTPTALRLFYCLFRTAHGRLPPDGRRSAGGTGISARSSSLKFTYSEPVCRIVGRV